MPILIEKSPRSLEKGVRAQVGLQKRQEGIKGYKMSFKKPQKMLEHRLRHRLRHYKSGPTWDWRNFLPFRVPVRLDWSIMGCTIRLRALINLGSVRGKKKKV